MSVSRIAFITIGEAPRLDLQSIYEEYYKGLDEVCQVGLLDGLMHEEAEDILGHEAGDSHILTSRFIDGYQVIMSGSKVEKQLQERVNQLEAQGVEIIGLLCTGEFPNLVAHKAELIAAEDVVIPYIRIKYPKGKIGIVTSLVEQLVGATHKWALGDQGVFTYASPYNVEADAFINSEMTLAEASVDAILFDYIGYQQQMHQMVKQVSGTIPLYLSNELLFQNVSQLYKNML